MKIESLFDKFIGSPDLREELQYCLTQSQVEQFVRFKFGFWLHQQNISNLNIIEIKRIDLVVGIDNEIFFIEFGHLLNLLKHKIESMCEKTCNDLGLLDDKIKSLSECGNFFEGKKLFKLTISLFTDIEMHEKNGKYTAKFTGDKNTGVFIKYGDRIPKKYINDFLQREIEGPDGINIGFGKYNETVVKDGELILRWIIGKRHEISL
jgi:hypothetical protein